MYKNMHYLTEFMPRATTRLLCARVPAVLAQLIVSFARDAELSAWDPYGLWAVPCREEYSRKDGSYGYLPSVPMVDTGLPLF